MSFMGQLLKIALGIIVIVIFASVVDLYLGAGIGIAAGLGFVFGDIMSDGNRAE